MGQKVNPIGFRLGINKTWDSKWYNEAGYAEWLKEDMEMRTLVKKQYKSAGISKIDIERDRIITEYGQRHDNFVVEARLAWHFIPDSFKICYQCDFDTRTKRIAVREKKDLAQVQKETQEREKAIYDRFAKYYEITDFENEKNFDLVIDTKRLNFNQVVETIMSTLKNLPADRQGKK